MDIAEVDRGVQVKSKRPSGKNLNKLKFTKIIIKLFIFRLKFQATKVI